MSFDSFSVSDFGASSDLDNEARTGDCVSPAFGGIEGLKAVTRRRIRILRPSSLYISAHARKGRLDSIRDSQMDPVSEGEIAERQTSVR